MHSPSRQRVALEMLAWALDPGLPNAAALTEARFAEPEVGQSSMAQQPELVAHSMWVGLSAQHLVWGHQGV